MLREVAGLPSEMEADDIESRMFDLTARGVKEAAALYEPPFNSLHAQGPDALFEGHAEVIEGIFETLEAVRSGLIAGVG